MQDLFFKNMQREIPTLSYLQLIINAVKLTRLYMAGVNGARLAAREGIPTNPYYNWIELLFVHKILF